MIHLTLPTTEAEFHEAIERAKADAVIEAMNASWKAMAEASERRMARWTYALDLVSAFGSASQRDVASAFSKATGKAKSRWLHPNCTSDEALYDAEHVIKNPKHAHWADLIAAMGEVCNARSKKDGREVVVVKELTVSNRSIPVNERGTVLRVSESIWESDRRAYRDVAYAIHFVNADIVALVPSENVEEITASP